MAITTLTFNNKKFQLACDDSQIEELNALARQLNERIMVKKKENPTVPFELLLVMVALSLQDEVQQLSAKVSNFDKRLVNNDEEKYAETLSTIAGYLEDLARRMGK